MLTLNAQVINCFRAPEGVSREGKAYGGEFKVQLQGVNVLKNGQKKVDLLTLTTTEPEKFSGMEGRQIVVDVGVFAANNSIMFYLPPNGAVTVKSPIESGSADRKVKL